MSPVTTARRIKIATPTCAVCGKAGEVEVIEAQYNSWKDGVLIQRAMPNLSEDEREMLITGIHGECWDKLFDADEEDSIVVITDDDPGTIA